MESKEYVMWVTYPGSEPKRVTKTEEELTQQDYNLFLGDLIETFNKCPNRTQTEFLMWVYRDNMGN
jgi:hypothetical protein